jgi:dTDP-4-amino-4,6-dideoxygalactose transaminase
MMQFRDLKTQYEVLKKEIDTAMIEVAGSGAFIMGKPVKELEAELAAYVESKHCIACANGTDALTLALKAWGIGKGDAVFVPDFTFFAPAEVVSLEGAAPVFVDVDRDTFNMDTVDLEEKIKKTAAEGKHIPKVIITVDMFGLPADYLEIREIADKYQLYILEDGAQGFGGRIGDKRACNFGDISTTSFFPAKPLGCYGDGGAIFTDNDEWAVLMDSYRVHGKGKKKFDNVRIGMNSRLDTLQAAILKVKFKAFREYELTDINRAAAKYTKRLQGKVKTPVVPEGYYSSWAQYTIQLGSKEERDALQARFKEHGVPSMIYYPTPIHKQTAYQSLNLPDGYCPVAQQLCHTVLSLPIHPYISDEDIEKVCNLIVG